jgi:hypothetical protein
MKKNILKFGFALSVLMLASCGSDDTNTKDSSTKEETSESNANCPDKNQIDFVKYDDAEQSFDQKDVYANYSKMYKSYRVLFLNYDKSLDTDYGTKTGDQQRIVVSIFNPKDDEFKPGKYTWEGDENGFNRIIVQVETADGIKSCNYAGDPDPGYIEVFDVDENHICGIFNVSGQGFAMSGTFNANHEKAGQ